MSPWAPDGRVFAREVVALVGPGAGDDVELLSPTVGLFRATIGPGTIVGGGAIVGELEVLGRTLLVRAPAEARGSVVAGSVGPLARRPVGHRDPLMSLRPVAVQTGGETSTDTHAGSGAGGALVFVAPSSGRFHRRPSPDKPPLVAVGDVVARGQAVAVLEVMKTFNRIAYGGPGLPERARVIEIVAADGDDVDAGSILLRLEPAP